MNTDSIRGELAARLTGWGGLTKAHPYPIGSATPPAVIVDLTQVAYDSTYDGDHIITGSVVMLAGKPNDLSAHKRLAAFLDDEGDNSLKSRLESGTYTTFGTIKVTQVVDGEAPWGDVPLLMGVFDFEISTLID